MGIKSKIRLEQLTGSLESLKQASIQSPVPMDDGENGTTLIDAQALLKKYGEAIARIHGKGEFTNQTRGLIDHDAGDIKIAGSDNDGAQKITLDQRDGTGTGALKFELLFDGSDDTKSTAQLTNVRGDQAAAVALQATAGGVDIDAAAAKVVDVSGGQVSLTSKTAQVGAIKLETDVGAAESITIVNKEGTIASSLDLQAEKGGITAKVADTKSLKMGNAGLDAYFEVAAHSDAAEEDVRIKNTNGTAAGAIEIDAAAGGVDIDAAAGKLLDLQGGAILLKNKTTGTDCIQIELDEGAADSFKLNNEQGNTDAAIDIGAVAGGVVIAGGKASTDAVVLEAGAADSRVVAKVNSTEVLRIANKSGRMTQNEAAFELGNGQELSLVHDFGSAAGYHQLKSTERLHLSGAANTSLSGMLVNISGSQAIGFVGGGIGQVAGSTFNFAGYNDTNGALILSDLSAATSYKTNFGSTSILGAINSVFDSVSATDPTLYIQPITTASINAGVPAGFYSSDIPEGGGSPAKFKTGPMADITPAKIEVFVNGQQLMSGSAADRAAGTADYNVNSPEEITFAFKLEIGDVVMIRDRT